ncbi:mRNA 3' end processing factor, partial [Elasticomyces elasticus]
MSAGLPSDEVAQDYKDALDDLHNNNKFQIINLTSIAQENIEHAEAIARVLILHIKKTAPPRKLPALYVLDSLVKNIGSPYTLYFGRNLHETFMLAYSQIDRAWRPKLEELLKTWRESVPGSDSATPVFPLSATQSILDAVNKYKAMDHVSRPQQLYAQFQQAQIRSPHLAQAAMPYTATPPPVRQYPQLNGTPQQHYAQPQQQVPQSQHYAPPTPQPVTQQYSQPQAQQFSPAFAGYAQPPTPVQIPQVQSKSNVDVLKLHSDIDDLTTDAKIECATHPMDQTAQRKLQTLQSLKEMLEIGNTSQSDLGQIRDTIMQQMAKKMAAKHVQQQQAAQYLPQPEQQYPQHLQAQFQQPPQQIPTPQYQHPYQNGY